MEFKKFSFIIIALCIISLPAQANEYNRTLEALNQLNDIRPLKNPAYERADEILKRRVIDQRNKVVGQVSDVIIKDNGSIEQLRVDFDRLNLGPEVFVSYRDLGARPASGSYLVGFTAEQIRTLYTTFLANVDTAAGGDDENYSVRKMLGTPVAAADGRKLGVIDNVLFTAGGARVEAILVNVQSGRIRGESVAIPLGMAKLETTMLGRRFVVGDDQADAMTDFLEDR